MTELNNGIQNGAQEVSKLMLKAVFWDMDGTLIDSEPYWHEGELKIAADHGGYWDEDLAWQGSGTPVPDVARRMVEHGCKLSIEEIGKGMIDYVAQKEFERIPWIDGVEDVLLSLKEAGVPSMLVTTSPRHLAENLIAQAPAGTFAGYVCGDDDVEKKPSPAPYLAAGRKLGIAPEDMKYCIAVEDSMSGLRSAAAPVPPRSARPASCASTIPTARNSPRSTATTASPPPRSTPTYVAATPDASAMRVVRLHNRRATRHNRHY